MFYTDCTIYMTPRTRRIVAAVCITAVLFAAFVPVVAADLPAVVLVPLWLVVPAVAVTLVRRRALRCDEQLVSLASLLPPRAPPRSA
jgi:hypothetical protein